MTSAYQPSMLDLMGASAAPALEPLRRAAGAASAHRGRLGRRACRAGCGHSDEVFERLLGIDWRADRRQMYDNVVDVPRLLRWFGGDEELPHPVLTEARETLSAHYADELGEPFVTAGMCLYRDGRDSVAWHGDTIGRSARHDTMVAILSLGLAAQPGAAAAGRRPRDAAVPARARRSDRDGRLLPAHLGARDPEDGPAGRPADQRAVPPVQRGLITLRKPWFDQHLDECARKLHSKCK